MPKSVGAWSENFRPFFRGRTGLYPFTRLYIEGSGSVWIQRRCGKHWRI
nr:MAG TPA: hypothetical protein [Caudoviricetes sp.]